MHWVCFSYVRKRVMDERGMSVFEKPITHSHKENSPVRRIYSLVRGLPLRSLGIQTLVFVYGEGVIKRPTNPILIRVYVKDEY